MPGRSPNTLAVLWTATIRIATSLMQGVLALLLARSHRKGMRELATMGDRELKDIGLTRLDVLAALDRPLHTDPSTPLSVRSVERRARSRAMALAAERKAARLAACPAPPARVTPRARAGA